MDTGASGRLARTPARNRSVAAADGLGTVAVDRLVFRAGFAGRAGRQSDRGAFHQLRAGALYLIGKRIAAAAAVDRRSSTAPLRALGGRAVGAADETRCVAGGDALLSGAFVARIRAGVSRRGLALGATRNSRASARCVDAAAAAVAVPRIAAAGRIRSDGDR